MKKLLLTLIPGILLFSSCDSSDTEEKYVFKDSTGLTTAAPVTNVQQQEVPSDNKLPVQINPTQQAVPLTVNPANMNKQFVAPNTAVTTTAPGMNPPHGQPGHRCDIDVGAPLNSKPMPKPTTISTTPAQTNVVQQTAPVTETLPGMNPPHGQPGHRCDIAVGAPLSSAPPKKDSSH